jgi:uncharacterized protein (UPF0261 family)
VTAIDGSFIRVRPALWTERFTPPASAVRASLPARREARELRAAAQRAESQRAALDLTSVSFRRLLTQAGVDGTVIGVGLAAGTLLQLAALCALPLLAVPSVALGLSVPTTLAKSAAVSAGLFVVLLALTALAVTTGRWLFDFLTLAAALAAIGPTGRSRSRC